MPTRIKILLLFLLTPAFFACSSDETPLSWSTWVANDSPVFQGQFPLVGDPSVINENGSYRMFYTGFDPNRTPQGPEICQATSTDGLNWTNVDVNDPVEGRMLYANSTAWSNAHETCFALKFNNGYFLYFVGYQDTGGGVFKSGPVSLGLATSADAKNFEAQPNPVVISSPQGFDRDALDSPSIIHYQDSLFMLYTGYCFTSCGPVAARLLAATSADGVTWFKKSTPVIDASEIAWAPKGVAEAEIVEGPDHFYYLFMTSVDEPHVIGVAKGKTPFGPWEVNPTPIVKADKSFSSRGAVAPGVVIENNRVRLWYHGFTSDKIQIGYAESAWPITN
nr:family 43 glycosylhydrolase [Chryseolinea soli]